MRPKALLFIIFTFLVSPLPTLAATPTDPNFKVAFTGDTGASTNFTNVLNLIRDEGAQMVIHAGDFDYSNRPSTFFPKIDSALGATFPYLGSNGNHDSWSVYVSGSNHDFRYRIDNNPSITIQDNFSGTDKNWVATYKGLKFLLLGDTAGSTSDATYIQNQLGSDTHTWKICAWHENGVPDADRGIAYDERSQIQPGEKPGSEAGTDIYEACRQAGAIIINAHEHSYARTKTITRFSTSMSIDSSRPANSLLVIPGSTFVAVSGAGGHSLRDYNCDKHGNYTSGTGHILNTWWGSVYTNNLYIKNGVKQALDCTITGSDTYGYKYANNIFPAGGINRYTFGALFITFNYNGDPNRAHAYFKNIDGQTVDEFDIYASGTVGPTNTPGPSPTPTRTPTPSPSPIPSSTPAPSPTGTPTIKNLLLNWLSSLLDRNGDNKANSLDFALLAGPQATPTPTHTPTPTPSGPTPTPISGACAPIPRTVPAYRAFKTDSYWNAPMPANAPIDIHNADYIQDSQTASENLPYMGLTAAYDALLQSFGYPMYWASPSDPTYTLTGSITAHIPLCAATSTGSDAAFIVYDPDRNQVVELWQGVYSSTSDTWSASSYWRYVLDSNGLTWGVSGSDNSLNTSNRGVPPPIRAVRVDEVQAGAINHRLECFWWATGIRDKNHYWPMSGDEGNKYSHDGTRVGIVPEGIVARIKPSVNLATKGLSAPGLVIATALQKYGCIVGDNSGAGNRVPLELNKTAWQNLGLTFSALQSIPWSDYEFIRGGYDPVTGTIVTP